MFIIIHKIKRKIRFITRGKVFGKSRRKRETISLPFKTGYRALLNLSCKHFSLLFRSVEINRHDLDFRTDEIHRFTSETDGFMLSQGKDQEIPFHVFAAAFTRMTFVIIARK